MIFCLMKNFVCHIRTLLSGKFGFVCLTLKKIKYTAAGYDGLPAECLRAEGAGLVKFMYQLIYRIRLEDSMPSVWNLSILYPVLRNRDFIIHTNYKGIVLLLSLIMNLQAYCESDDGNQAPKHWLSVAFGLVNRLSIIYLHCSKCRTNENQDHSPLSLCRL